MPKDKTSKPHAPVPNFKKGKIKAGKKLIPQSTTNTSFTAKTIALPNQSFLVDKSNQATNSRNQTFTDITVRLSQTNASTRKDALIGLRDLLDRHPALIKSKSLAIIHSTAALLTDADSSVRRGLYTFLDWYLHVLPNELLEPFIGVLCRQTITALSDINELIKMDAFKLVDLLLELDPHNLTNGFNQTDSATVGHHLFAMLLSVLGLHVGGSMLTTRLIPSRAIQLRTLANFLRATIHSTKDDDHHLPLFLLPAFKSESGFQSFLNEVRPEYAITQSSARRHNAWLVGETYTVPASSTSRVINGNRTLDALYALLGNAMHESYADAFVDNTDRNHLVIIENGLELLDLLGPPDSSRKSAAAAYSKALDRASLHLPAMANSNPMMDQINTKYCRLVARSVTGSGHQDERLMTVSDWILDRLTAQGGSRETADQFLSLRSLYWNMLNHTATAEKTVKALVSVCRTTGPSAALHRVVNQFLQDITNAQLEPAYIGRFDWTVEPLMPEYESWVSLFPRHVYKAGQARLTATDDILRFSLKLAKYANRSPLSRAVTQHQFVSGFSTFFSSDTPDYGLHFGPWALLNEDAQAVAICLSRSLALAAKDDKTRTLLIEATHRAYIRE